MNKSLLRSLLVNVLREEIPTFDEEDLPDFQDNRTVLEDMLISSTHHWKEETLKQLDEIWKNDSIDVKNVEHFPGSIYQGTKVALWKGDITCLQGPNLAIVNAANDQGLGCLIPSHRCIDNVIHRRAGPRLRMECREILREQNRTLAAGTYPIVTAAYHLPCDYVIHVTGPQIKKGESVSYLDQETLSNAYQLSLDAAVTEGAKAIAFPCISTGLFGFPADQAATVALSAVEEWLARNPNMLDTIVFNVFTDRDHRLYQQRFRLCFPVVATDGVPSIVSTSCDYRNLALRLARSWIQDADAVLICAGAGMSAKQGEMVYTNPNDFAAAYPWFVKWGYKTSYEVMGLEEDTSVPQTAKWALYAKHMDNMRWSFAPNEGYSELLQLVNDKNYFVLTSNVDGCFERSGFDASRIYSPQGDWAYVQCKEKCQRDSVYASRPYLDAMLPHISQDGNIPLELIPICPRCGGAMFGNVRGGSWYLHHMYENQNIALQEWMQNMLTSHAKVVILEIGAGFNTPTVTRFPVESFARELGNRAAFVRVNPSDPKVPEDLQAIAFDEGWQVLKEVRLSGDLHQDPQEVLSTVRQHQLSTDLTTSIDRTRAYSRYFRHFDWRMFLSHLQHHGD